MTETSFHLPKALLHSAVGTFCWMLGYLLILFVLGKYWGSELFGLFNLIITFSYVVSLVLLFGIDTGVTYFLSRGKDYKNPPSQVWKMAMNVLGDRKKLIFTSLVIIFLFALYLTGINGAISSIILGVAYAFRTLADARLRGLMMFRNQARIKILELAILAVGASVCLIIDDKLIIYPVLFMTGAYISTYALATLLSRPHPTASKEQKLSLVEFNQYSVWAGIGGVGGLVMAYLDKPMVRVAFDLTTVGLYSAYYFWAMAGVNTLIALAINVLFPIVSAHKNKIELKLRLDWWTKRVSFAVLAGIFFLIRIGIELFGGEYVFDPALAGAWTVYAGLFFYCNILWWLINAYGVRGIRFTAITSLVSYGLVGLMIVLAGKGLSLTGLVLVMALGLGLNIILANKIFKFAVD
ncbi:hypothetical protein A2397_05085 [Candidatus Amesbacteria bacterium RIFOXYB1_FULL_44_23]|uniref:Polysaccharide biosynthesis protein C-terminal domain-containing protein n=1 Tax=Candidatus Amesbacteria bacterium RIFOXYB1_FULL_44_23 TaxID=1797263 RepID=A0A1F4ZRE8_9BACT|nr:MAG: hypothetical protein A2397_05085 [Candidatus Amesbacteria bacterium RIFOXYB1_FULL_44_23]